MYPVILLVFRSCISCLLSICSVPVVDVLVFLTSRSELVFTLLAAENSLILQLKILNQHLDYEGPYLYSTRIYSVNKKVKRINRILVFEWIVYYAEGSILDTHMEIGKIRFPIRFALPDDRLLALSRFICTIRKFSCVINFRQYSPICLRSPFVNQAFNKLHVISFSGDFAGFSSIVGRFMEICFRTTKLCCRILNIICMYVYENRLIIFKNS